MYQYAEKNNNERTNGRKKTEALNNQFFSGSMTPNTISGKEVIQCRLKTVADNSFSKIYDGIELNRTDIQQLNSENYEEIQSINERDRTGALYYGTLDESFISDNNNLVVIGLKTRFSSGSSYYGVNTPGADNEIAFSNKMTLRGYIFEDCASSLLKKLAEAQKVKASTGKKGYVKDSNEVNTDKKITMASKTWYLPVNCEETKFADIAADNQQSAIVQWNLILNSCRTDAAQLNLDSNQLNEIPMLQAGVDNMASLMNVMHSDEIVPVDRASKSVEIDGQMQDALVRRRLLTSDHKLWTVKDEISLKHRLSKYTPLTVQQLGGIHIYNDSGISPRPIEQMASAQLIEETNDNKYKWKVKNLEDLGDKYACIDSRSHKEWLELKNLWENPDNKDPIINMWRKTARLHLDSTGLLNITDTSAETFQFQADEKSSIGDKLIEAHIIGTSGDAHGHGLAQDSEDGNYKWLVSTVRELGDKSSDICINKNIWDSVLKLWNRTHRTKIQYSLDKKWNLWHQTPTEWGINSTANAGASDQTPFTGWSIFTYNKSNEHTCPVDFHLIRSAEKKHFHPYQTEIYKITEGTAYIFVNTQVERFTQGTTLNIMPNTTHYIVAIEDPYRHLVIQEPSAFHRKDNKTPASDADSSLAGDYKESVELYQQSIGSGSKS